MAVDVVMLVCGAITGSHQIYHGILPSYFLQTYFENYLSGEENICHWEETWKISKEKYMKGVKKICLSCKYFRLETVEKGICRVDKDSDKSYPGRNKNDDCSRWQDCGQNYFIRIGWIKGKSANVE